MYYFDAELIIYQLLIAYFIIVSFGEGNLRF